MIVIHFNLWHESSSPLFLPGLFVNVLAALLASGGAALTLKETINQIPVLVLNGVAATSLLLSFMGVIRKGSFLSPSPADLVIVATLTSILKADFKFLSWYHRWNLRSQIKRRCKDILTDRQLKNCLVSYKTKILNPLIT